MKWLRVVRGNPDPNLVWEKYTRDSFGTKIVKKQANLFKLLAFFLLFPNFDTSPKNRTFKRLNIIILMIFETVEQK